MADPWLVIVLLCFLWTLYICESVHTSVWRWQWSVFCLWWSATFCVTLCRRFSLRVDTDMRDPPCCLGRHASFCSSSNATHRARIWNGTFVTLLKWLETSKRTRSVDREEEWESDWKSVVADTPFPLLPCQMYAPCRRNRTNWRHLFGLTATFDAATWCVLLRHGSQRTLITF